MSNKSYKDNSKYFNIRVRIRTWKHFRIQAFNINFDIKPFCRVYAISSLLCRGKINAINHKTCHLTHKAPWQLLLLKQKWTGVGDCYVANTELRQAMVERLGKNLQLYFMLTLMRLQNRNTQMLHCSGKIAIPMNIRKVRYKSCGL